MPRDTYADAEARSYQLRTSVESELAELAELWTPREAIEWVEEVAERMREELAEVDAEAGAGEVAS